MPLATIYLVALSRKTPAEYLHAIKSSVQPLVTSRPIKWVIKPEKLSTNLLNTEWDLLIILPASSKIPSRYLGQDWISEHWSITAGVPSSLTNDFDKRNNGLLYPREGDVPSLTGSQSKGRVADSSQSLEVSDELLAWSKSFELGQRAVSMLNLLAFKPGQEAHESYLRYGKGFAESAGSKRGGLAKIVGKVVPNQGTVGEDKSGWDEIALAHYPSIHHFIDMLASEDYQKINHEHRLPSLKDTLILCTSELDPELGQDKAKL